MLCTSARLADSRQRWQSPGSGCSCGLKLGSRSRTGRRKLCFAQLCLQTCSIAALCDGWWSHPAIPVVSCLCFSNMLFFFLLEVLLRLLKACFLLLMDTRATLTTEDSRGWQFPQPHILVMGASSQASMVCASIWGDRTPALAGPSPFSGPWTCSHVDGLPPALIPVAISCVLVPGTCRLVARPALCLASALLLFLYL